MERTAASVMRQIRQLPPSVVNKIAAGEVIERPASVVKELVENAIDAGAGRVDVSVGRGGMELIRVADDGCGIPADELELAVASHATSKLADADDLYRVATLGFRGEALASIAEVSRLRLRSRPAEAAEGAELEVTGGRDLKVTPCGAPPGTLVEVQNLFFNTPVRRKFMRTVPTEMGHVGEALVRIALAHPQVHFTLKHNDRTVHDLPPSDHWVERIAQFFGRDLAENLLWVESEAGEVKLWGYVANPTHSRANSRMQYLFLNGRYVRDRSLQHALGEAYRGLLLSGRYPICFLAFEMPAEMVDVNVHPTKLEVRFQQGDRHYAQLLGTLRERFLTSDLTARWKAEAGEGGEEPAGDEHDEQTLRQRQEIVDWAKQQLAGPGGGEGAGAASGHEAAPGAGPPHFDERRAETLLHLKRQAAGRESQGAAPADADVPPEEGYEVERPAAQAEAARAARAGGHGMQILNRYLVTENDDGVVIIDQHALHERVLYELLREKVLDSAVESQKLLVPEPVDLGAAEAAAVLEQQELLARLGLTVEPFGGDTVLVSSYPAMLANFRPGEVLRGIADRLVDEGKAPERRDLLDELLHMISCKAAIKAGDRLTAEEIDALIDSRDLVQDTHHCPHGRPTSLVFTREELDRQFKRT